MPQTSSKGRLPLRVSRAIGERRSDRGGHRKVTSIDWRASYHSLSLVRRRAGDFESVLIKFRTKRPKQGAADRRNPRNFHGSSPPPSAKKEMSSMHPELLRVP